MPIIKTSLFKIEKIDQEKGHCVVRFINKYGPIETGEKTLDDFKIMIEYNTGSFYANGAPIMSTQEQIVNNNPNEDIIYNYDIPLNLDGTFISANSLVDFLAKQYPESVFEDMNKRKKASKIEEYNQLINQEFNIEIEYPDLSPPIPYVEDITSLVEDI